MMEHWYGGEQSDGLSRSRRPDYTTEGLYCHGVYHADVQFDYESMPTHRVILPQPISLAYQEVATAALNGLGTPTVPVELCPSCSGPVPAPQAVPAPEPLCPSCAAPVPVPAASVPTPAPAPTLSAPAFAHPAPQYTNGGGCGGELGGGVGVGGAAAGKAAAAAGRDGKKPATKARAPKEKKPRAPTILERVKKEDILAVMHLPLKEAADQLKMW